jgi:hypothetical protein
MPTSEAELRHLRMRLEAAYDAYQSCVTTLVQIERRRERPSPEFLASEAATLRTLNDARERYREAILEAEFSPHAP